MAKMLDSSEYNDELTDEAELLTDLGVELSIETLYGFGNYKTG